MPMDLGDPPNCQQIDLSPAYGPKSSNVVFSLNPRFLRGNEGGKALIFLVSMV